MSDNPFFPVDSGEQQGPVSRSQEAPSQVTLHQLRRLQAHAETVCESVSARLRQHQVPISAVIWHDPLPF